MNWKIWLVLIFIAIVLLIADEFRFGRELKKMKPWEDRKNT